MEYVVGYLCSLAGDTPVLVGVTANGAKHSVTTQIKHFKKFPDFQSATALVARISNAEVKVANFSDGVSYSVIALHQI